MSNEHFSCGCKDGETRVIADNYVEHKCGFRPSASYGTLNVWMTYKRVKNIAGHYNWFVDWQSTK